MKLALLLLLPIIALVHAGGRQGRVLLSDVQTLTLYRGQKTNARRVSAVPQLKCVGGSARGAFEPDVVQCYNRGSNGIDVQWECNAEMPKQYRFGKLSVSCEGYDYPDDPHILEGSCGLEYHLEKTDKSYYGSPTHQSSGSSLFSFLIKVGLIIGVFFFVRSFLSGNRPGGVAGMSAGPDHRPPGGGGGGGWFSNFFPGGFGGFGGFGGGAPGNTGRRPPPPGFRTDYAYDGADCHTTRQGTGGNFWTGAAMGAVGGYLFGNRNRRNVNYAVPNTGTTGWFGGGGTTTQRRTSSPSFSSGSTHTSTGFGGTTRR